MGPAKCNRRAHAAAVEIRGVEASPVSRIGKPRGSPAYQFADLEKKEGIRSAAGVTYMIAVSPTRKAGGPGRAQPAPIGTDVPWFEIELIDADGRPVVGQRYEVHGPDGVRVVGHTRPDGRALIVGVAADRCRVFLPDLDAEWTEIWQQ